MSTHFISALPLLLHAQESHLQLLQFTPARGRLSVQPCEKRQLQPLQQKPGTWEENQKLSLNLCMHFSLTVDNSLIFLQLQGFAVFLTCQQQGWKIVPPSISQRSKGSRPTTSPMASLPNAKFHSERGTKEPYGSNLAEL